ncbi:LVIVD repeat-containing protein [Gemmatimonas sp.]|uniref:LVIVD repeat-containing protein n=1 Tax=Gemmatimonas sp. TaxID=1962908 RepID=UPI003568B1AF
MHTLPTRAVLVVAAAAAFAACAPRKPVTAPSPASDPRNNLKAGLFDAAEYTSNLKVVSRSVSPKGFLGETNSDLAFTGNYVIQGNYNGPVVWDISNPSQPKLVVAYECPASQNDVSVYKNLMFMSAEAMNGRVDCKPGGVKDVVSKDRVRGVRIFDITNIREPKLVANVQTCRGSHTHTVLEDPKDKNNVYIYVSGSSGIRPAGELAECVAAPSGDANSSRLRIEIIKVPLADPAAAAVVGRANIFAGLGASKSHGASPADKADMDAAKAKGAFTIMIPAMNEEVVLPNQLVQPVLDSIMKARGATVATAADTAAARPVVNAFVTRMFAAQGMDKPPVAATSVSEGSQCHDITVYPALGLAGGACEGHGLLLDISNPIAPVRLDAVADSNFAYWHSATFNNDGTKMLFSDEWGGGGSPKCRALDKPEWGANAIFAIVNKKLVFQSYYKIPTYQSKNENCVAHNGSLIPIPGRDVMVQSWYQGGISVFDWTDAAHPKEIASFDRGPVDSTRMEMGGSWSVYWYNGNIVSSEIARGMDVAQLIPSEFISQNEIDAANTVKWDYLNAQGQPKISWPPSFALAKAFTDQLERKGCVAPARISDIRSQIASAEQASGAARNGALSKLVTDVESNRSCDPAKVDLLKKALQDLQALAM